MAESVCLETGQEMESTTFEPFRIGTRHGVEIFLSHGEGFYFIGVDVKGNDTRFIYKKLGDLTDKIDELFSSYLSNYGLTLATYQAQLERN